MKKLHIDADRIVYAVGFACETQHDDGTFTCDEPIANVLHSVKLSLEKIKEAFYNEVKEPFETVVHLTGKENFRFALYPEYKQTRADSRKPILANEIRQYMIDRWDAVVSEGMEADDAIGIAMHSDKNAVCCSGDKDLLNCPGYHFHPKTLKLEIIDDEFSTWHFYKQLLMGDKVDNIPGCRYTTKEMYEKYKVRKTKGIGEKSAVNFLQDCATEQEMFLRCLELYTAREKAECEDAQAVQAEQGALEDMLMNGRCLWMTRELHEDGTPKLWMEEL